MKRKTAIIPVMLILFAAILGGCSQPHTHSYGEWSVTRVSTCSEAGVQERTCSCGHKETEALPLSDQHNYVDSKEGFEPTCKSEGALKYVCSDCNHVKVENIPKLEHTWVDATCKQPKTCSGCGRMDGHPLGCTPGADGKCTRCGE